jgi:hypothetical protein
MEQKTIFIYSIPSKAINDGGLSVCFKFSFPMRDLSISEIQKNIIKSPV